MKSILLTFVLSLFATAAMARPFQSYDIKQLKADKVFVLKQESIKLQKMLAKTGLLKTVNKHDCDDIDIDIDVDVDTHSGGMDANCEARWSDGSCMRWGSDQPGTCYPYCEARWSDGSCMRWGADVCN